MSTPSRGLGRGLEALWGDTNSEHPAAAAKTTVTEVRIHQIEPNQHQPRRNFPSEALEELAASIKSQGIIQPIVVRPTTRPQCYEIIAGERRWRAAQLASLETVPVYVRTLDDSAMMLAALIENLQREDLNPVEEALALKELRDTYAMTQDEIAQKIGKARTSVANTLRLLALSEAAQDDLQSGRITAGHARALLAVTEADAQELLRARVVTCGLTVRETEDAANRWKSGAGFPWADEAAPAQPADEARPKSRSLSPALKTVQATLSQQLGVKSSLSGTAEQGKLTLKYTSTVQLLELLQKLGMDIDSIQE